MDGKTLAGAGLLLMLLVVASSGGGKSAKKPAKHTGPHVSKDGWICDGNQCRYVGVPGQLNVRAPGTRVTIPVNPMPTNERLRQLEQRYTSTAAPAVDLAPDQRKKNWQAPSGSCVHATTISLLRWTGDPELIAIAEAWPQSYGGGESSRGLRQKIEAKNLKYAMTVDGDVELLKWGIATRRGVGIAWGGHCIAVVGYDPATNSAILLDNNKTKSYQRMDWDKMISRWQNDRNGGWCWCFVYPPPAPIPNTI